MSVVTGIGLVVVAYSLGFVCCGVLACGLVRDLRALLTLLLENPNDAHIRARVAATLYQQDEG